MQKATLSTARAVKYHVPDACSWKRMHCLGAVLCLCFVWDAAMGNLLVASAFA
jgi:hypothetical protein